MALNAKNGEAWYKRGNVRLVRRDYDGAVADYDKAIEMLPTLAQAKTNRDMALRMKAAK